jgi:hypothetical protein
LIIKLIAASLTLLFGIWAVAAPEKVMSLIGMAATGPRGITEARVALGAIYIGLGAYCLWTRTPAAFATLGAAYCVMATVRLISIFADGSADTSNWASLAVEALCGLVLLVL